VSPVKYEMSIYIPEKGIIIPSSICVIILAPLSTLLMDLLRKVNSHSGLENVCNYYISFLPCWMLHDR
jgi:hypothetical protein